MIIKQSRLRLFYKEIWANIIPIEMGYEFNPFCGYRKENADIRKLTSKETNSNFIFIQIFMDIGY
ncbi:hypothetical protein SAMN05421761_12121 [Belliella pelovolcani]|uniref:Uncharacterized protein n=1 Tax=Belliella pelovolcani TaxID=529505 RepID=A0A1N7PUV9_9BACT|nr:hypothetical protein SAMN05421761_12121 [Belliella pelovolcani]